jgi:zinc transporter ZupT
MHRKGSLERRMLLNAAVAAAVTGALVALAGCVFATFCGLPPSPAVLAGVVAGAALALALATVVAIRRLPGPRRALGLDDRPPPARRSGR